MPGGMSQSAYLFRKWCHLLSYVVPIDSLPDFPSQRPPQERRILKRTPPPSVSVTLFRYGTEIGFPAITATDLETERVLAYRVPEVLATCKS
jgi:hypothetical protein